MLVGQYNGPLKSVFPYCVSLQGTKCSGVCSSLVSHTKPLPTCRTLSSGCQHPPSWGPGLLDLAAISWLRATGSAFLPQILESALGMGRSPLSASASRQVEGIPRCVQQGVEIQAVRSEVFCISTLELDSSFNHCPQPAMYSMTNSAKISSGPRNRLYFALKSINWSSNFFSHIVVHLTTNARFTRNFSCLLSFCSWLLSCYLLTYDFIIHDYMAFYVKCS